MPSPPLRRQLLEHLGGFLVAIHLRERHGQPIAGHERLRRVRELLDDRAQRHDERGTFLLGHRIDRAEVLAIGSMRSLVCSASCACGEPG